MIVDTKVRELLEEIKQLTYTGINNCFAILAMCNNCLAKDKCKALKSREKLREKIDSILEV